ncbi:MAG TPA: ComEA family DNA-binding protein [Aggregatilineales bacterium]|nr:ComEA family DNA-binding protein [Aggregatilineales bacterium]
MPILERFKYPILLGVGVMIAIGVVALLTYEPPAVAITIYPPAPSATPPPTDIPPPTNTPAPLLIYVTGAVQRSNETYALPKGSRVQDAIQAAGGYTTDADPRALNPVRLLRDGEQIDVPKIGANLPTATPRGTASIDDPVYINTADLQELTRLPGVGETLAKAILTYREQHGAFKAMADLDAVPGIGAGRLAQWEGLIIFE